MDRAYTRERLPIDVEDRIEPQPADAVITREEVLEAFEANSPLNSAPVRIGSAGTVDPPPLDHNYRALNSVHLFQQAYGNIATLKHYGPAVQAKLQTSQPGDASETEANRIADIIVKMPPNRQPYGNT